MVEKKLLCLGHLLALEEHAEMTKQVLEAAYTINGAAHEPLPSSAATDSNSAEKEPPKSWSLSSRDYCHLLWRLEMKTESIPSHTEQSTKCWMVQSTEPIRVDEARRHCSEREHPVMGSHWTQQLPTSVPELRPEHQQETEKGRRRGLWTSAQRNISNSPSPGISKCVTGNRCQISNSPPLNLGKPLVLKHRFLCSKCSPVFWFSFTVIFVRSWWKESDTAQYRCHQSKRRNLVSTLQCHPQQNRQNITKNQYSRRLSSNAFCLVWLLTSSVVDWDFFKKHMYS